MNNKNFQYFPIFFSIINSFLFTKSCDKMVASQWCFFSLIHKFLRTMEGYSVNKYVAVGGE